MLTWVLYYVRLLQATNLGYLINAQDLPEPHLDPSLQIFPFEKRKVHRARLENFVPTFLTSILLNLGRREIRYYILNVYVLMNLNTTVFVAL